MRPESFIPSPAPRDFAATRWTLVLRAKGQTHEARTALSDLCAAYYHPVLAFVRRSGFSSDEGRDLTHAFFARLLASGGFSSPDQQKGRFRCYLIAAVRYFLRDQNDWVRRQKRGSGEAVESLDDHARQVADPANAFDDAAFDREWATTIMNRVMAELAKHYEGEKHDQFEALRPWLMGEGVCSHADTAARLGISEGAVKTSVHRLRQRFRELLRAEITQTLTDPAELNDELRHLCAALSQDL